MKVGTESWALARVEGRVEEMRSAIEDLRRRVLSLEAALRATRSRRTETPARARVQNTAHAPRARAPAPASAGASPRASGRAGSAARSR